MTTTDLIAYYQNLLIMQYALQPNALATIQAYVKQAIAGQIVAQVRDAFNLPTGVGPLSTTAQGVQLEKVATYRGLTRQVYGFSLTRVNMVWPFYGDSAAPTDPGFALYGNTAPTWFFLRYEDANAPIYQMNDSELTRMIQLRSLVQSQFLSVAEVDAIVLAFFGLNVAVFENGAMNLTYLVLSSDPDSLFWIAQDTKSLPRPAGVGLGVVKGDSITGLFGFQQYSQAYNYTFVGFGQYGTAQAGTFLRYQ